MGRKKTKKSDKNSSTTKQQEEDELIFLRNEIKKQREQNKKFWIMTVTSLVIALAAIASAYLMQNNNNNNVILQPTETPRKTLETTTTIKEEKKEDAVLMEEKKDDAVVMEEKEDDAVVMEEEEPIVMEDEQVDSPVSVVVVSDSDDDDDIVLDHVATTSRVVKQKKHVWLLKGSTMVGPHNRSKYGFDVQITDNDVLVVGIPGWKNETGAVQAYHYDDNDEYWKPMGSILQGREKAENFGRAVRYHHDDGTLAVGGMGIAGLYKQNDGNWIPVKGGDAYLEPPNESSTPKKGFGFKIEYAPIDDDDFLLVVGEPGSDVVYTYDAEMEVLETLRGKDQMGVSLALSRRTMAVGCPFGGKEKAGTVTLYDWDDVAGWSKGQTLRDGYAAGDWCGQSMSLQGNRLAIGCPGYNGPDAAGAGRVLVYHYQNDKWILQDDENDVLVGQDAGNEFGFSVALSQDGNTLAVGAIWNDGGGVGPRAGHARVFRYIDGEWEKMGPDLVGERPGDWFGQAVALSPSGHQLAVGAICRNNGWEGYVKVYELLDK